MTPEALQGPQLFPLAGMLLHGPHRDRPVTASPADSGGTRDSGSWGGWEASSTSFQSISVFKMRLVRVLPIKRTTTTTNPQL